jgi:phosphatidylserine decarboxylase
VNAHLLASGCVLPLAFTNAVEDEQPIPRSSAEEGAQSSYKDAFAGGTLTHTYLDVGDYHHYHFPLDGVVREARVIPGAELSGGIISWDAKRGRYSFDPTAAGWQALETRASVILETPDFGLVALLPIGMSPVVQLTPAVVMLRDAAAVASW